MGTGLRGSVENLSTLKAQEALGGCLSADLLGAGLAGTEPQAGSKALEKPVSAGL